MMRRFWLLSLFCLTLAVTAVGCDGSTSEDATPDTVEATDTPSLGTDQAEAPDDAAATGDYPAGPYGTTEGAIIENHSFYDPAAGTDVSFEDLRNTDKKLLLLTSGAGWCSACKLEATELEPKYDEYGPQGLEIWSTLFQDFNGNPATEGFWNNWKAQFNPNYPLLLDADFVLSAYFNPDSAPMNMLIRLDTMEIIFLKTGFDPVVVEGEIKKFLE